MRHLSPSLQAEGCGPLLEVAVQSAAADATESRPSALGEPPEWIELIPAGRFSGADGRGPYLNTTPDAVVAETRADMQRRGLSGGIPLDYDHATDFRERGPAPAAGWIVDFEVRNGAIWGRVDWTPDGAEHVRAKHWKYISPVFLHSDDEHRHVTCLLHAALTNDPNLRLAAVAASRTSRSSHMADTTPLSEVAKAAEKAFPNLAPSQIAQLIEFYARLVATPPENAEEVEKEIGEDEPGAGEPVARDGHAATCQDASCSGQCRQATQEDEMSAHAASQAAGGSDAAAAASVRDPRDEQIMALTTRINQVEHERATERATQAVDAAIRAFKLTPAQRAWAVEYATRDLQGFRGFCDRQPALMQQQIDPKSDHGTRSPVPAYDKHVVEICNRMGVTVEDFVKYINANKHQPGSIAAICAARVGA